MIFSNKNRVRNNINLNMDNTEIERVTVTKFLGVLVDENLNWKQHIIHVRNKLSKCSAIIYKASRILQSSTFRDFPRRAPGAMGALKLKMAP